jgi:uncharacterized iron-regulated membrane protein
MGILKAIKLRRLSLSLHNWVGLLIVIQFLFWCLGGVVMTVIPLDLVRGETNMAPKPDVSVSGATIAQLTAGFGANVIRSVTVRSVAGAPALLITYGDDQQLLVDATTGTTLSPISETLAGKIAVADFVYEGASNGTPPQKACDVNYLTEEPGDFRRPLPVWQVHLCDPDDTKIYVSPQSGEVLARRNIYWRFYDFFWMLHIMDYETRDNTNNLLIITASITSTLFVITGFILLYFRFWPKRRTQKRESIE